MGDVGADAEDGERVRYVLTCFARVMYSEDFGQC